jgi:putative transposase
MSRYNFSVGAKFLLDGIEHKVNTISYDEIVVELTKYKQLKTYNKKELYNEWFEERLTFEDKEGRSSFAKLDIEHLSIEEKEEIRIKLKVLDPIIKGEKIIVSEHLQMLSEQENINICVATFYNWRKNWEAGGVRCLFSGKPGPKKRRTEAEVLETLEGIMEEQLYSGVTIPCRLIHRNYKRELNEINQLRDADDKIVIRSAQTIWRIISEKRDHYREMKARGGRVAADLERDGSRESVKPDRPLQRVELDWTPIDIYLVDPRTLKRKKAWLVYAIDVFSGEPLGFYISFDYPDSFAIRQCLLHCFTPKTYLKKLYPDVQNEWSGFGIPKLLVVDNASSNNSYDLEDVFNFFGIDPLFPEVAAGHKKGTVERGLKTFNDIVHTLKGTTFSNIYEKKDYDSEGNACITLQAFYYIAHIIFVDIISHNFSHSRIIGRTPHEIWEQGLKDNPHLSLDMPWTKKEIKIALGGGTERRVISNKGVVIEQVQFRSDALSSLRYKLLKKGDEGKEVIIRFDLSDMRTVYIQDPYETGTFIEAYPDQNTLKDYSKRFGLEPTLPLPFQQIVAYCLELGREARGFEDASITNAMKKIKGIEKQQDSDQKKDYAETIKLESEMLAGLALASSSYEELEPPIDAETFKYVGEGKPMKRKIKKKKLNKESSEQSIDSIGDDDSGGYFIGEIDDLPDYDVSFLGGD